MQMMDHVITASPPDPGLLLGVGDWIQFRGFSFGARDGLDTLN